MVRPSVARLSISMFFIGLKTDVKSAVWVYNKLSGLTPAGSRSNWFCDIRIVNCYANMGMNLKRR